MLEKKVCIEGIFYTYIIGTNANENFKLIDMSNPYDLWFHVANYPSCHVICQLQEDKKYDKKLLRKIVKQGALCCKQYCKYKNISDLSITYTYIKNISKTDIIGQVNTTNAKYISI